MDLNYNIPCIIIVLFIFACLYFEYMLGYRFFKETVIYKIYHISLQIINMLQYINCTFQSNLICHVAIFSKLFSIFHLFQVYLEFPQSLVYSSLISNSSKDDTKIHDSLLEDNHIWFLTSFDLLGFFHYQFLVMQFSNSSSNIC